MVKKSAKKKILSGIKLRQTLRGHKDRINRIAWSPDGRLLASPSSDNTLRIWNTETGTLYQSLGGHFDGVGCVAWTPNGQTLASSDPEDPTIRVWDVATGEVWQTLKGSSNGVNSVAWSPDGRTLASGDDDGVQLWNLWTRQLLKGHSDVVFSVAWSPNGQILASGGGDGVRLWDKQTGELRLTLQWQSSALLNVVYSVAWSPDEQTLASVGDDGTIQLWNSKTGQQIGILSGHTKSIHCVSFSCDGRILASKSGDGTVRFWNCNTWEPVAILEEICDGGFWPPGLAFNPKASVLATLGEQDTVIRIWDLDLDVLLGTTKDEIEKRQPIVDAEQLIFPSQMNRAKVRQMDKPVDVSLDNESKEGIHRGQVMMLVNQADQICWPLPDKAYGLDVEIEFRDENGKPSGQRIYMQLKSGASYLKARKDGTFSFYIQKKDHIDYWQRQSYPVYLCVRDDNGKMYWKNVTEYIAKQPNKNTRTIVFSDKDEMTIEALKAVRKIRIAHLQG